MIKKMKHWGSPLSKWYKDIKHPNLSVNRASKIVRGGKTFWYTGTSSYAQTSTAARKQFKGRISDFKKADSPFGLQDVRVIKVKRRTHGLAKITRGGRVIGWT